MLKNRYIISILSISTLLVVMYFAVKTMQKDSEDTAGLTHFNVSDSERNINRNSRPFTDTPVETEASESDYSSTDVRQQQELDLVLEERGSRLVSLAEDYDQNITDDQRRLDLVEALENDDDYRNAVLEKFLLEREASN